MCIHMEKRFECSIKKLSYISVCVMNLRERDTERTIQKIFSVYMWWS